MKKLWILLLMLGGCCQKTEQLAIGIDGRKVSLFISMAETICFSRGRALSNIAEHHYSGLKEDHYSFDCEESE